jgi:hypothetical protein
MLLRKVGKSDREGTFSGAHGNGEVAPSAVIPALAPERGSSTLSGRSLVLAGRQPCPRAGVYVDGILLDSSNWDCGGVYRCRGKPTLVNTATSPANPVRESVAGCIKMM